MINGCLYQKDNKTAEKYVICYTSKVLQPAQCRYTHNEKRMLALHMNLKRLGFILHGYKIHISIDYELLLRQFRDIVTYHVNAAHWIVTINSFSIICDLRERKHMFLLENPIPELTLNGFNATVSYLGVQMEKSLITALKNLHLHQETDSQIKYIIDHINNDRFSKKYKLNTEKHNHKDYQILHRTFTNNASVPVLPSELVYDTVVYLHEYFAHPGAQKLQILMQKYFYFNNMTKYLKKISKSCLPCRLNKIYGEKPRPVYAPVRATQIAEKIFMDIFGPLPESKHKINNVLVAKDIFSSCTWLFPMTNSTTKTCITQTKKLIRDIHSIGEKINTIVTDNGLQFTSNEWQNFLIEENIKLTHVSPYSPQASSAERTMRGIATKFRIYLNSTLDQHDDNYTHEKWVQEIKQIEICLNETPNKLNLTPNQIWGIDELKTRPFAEVGRKPTDVNYITLLKTERENLKRRFSIPSISSQEIFNMRSSCQTNDILFDDDKNALVSVDGAYKHNGEKTAVASIGIFFSPESTINVAEKINLEKVSNNIAELMAVVTTLKILAHFGITKVIITTDSKYVETNYNKHLHKWQTNNWQGANKKQIENKPLFEQLLNLRKQFHNLKIRHTFGHKYDHFNFLADKLATSVLYDQENEKLINQIDEVLNNSTSDSKKVVHLLALTRQHLRDISEEQKYNALNEEVITHNPGDLILISTHTQSNSDRKLIQKFFPKRQGPYEIIKRLCKNCYYIQNLNDPEDKKTVNTIQIVKFATVDEIKKNADDPKWKSLLKNSKWRQLIT